ncbi:tectonin domain-containing protein [Kocuria sp. M1R5S2]|uniref:tectonin domain-containing protein n=1 Tax=Kocuria rhizosphaerae TaxID=3376285 RepID=UPI003797AF5F
MQKTTFVSHARTGLYPALLVAMTLTACTPGTSALEPPEEAASDRTPRADQLLAEPPQSIEIGWTELPGEIKEIGVGGISGDASVWALSEQRSPGGYEVNWWNGKEWEGLGRGAAALDVSPDGYPWIVDSDGGIFSWDGSDWTERPGSARDIGIGADGSVWIVGTDPVPGGYGIYRWTETSWEQAPGGAVAIDVATQGDAAVGHQSEPWTIDENDRISRWTGSEWSQQPGEARDIGVGANGAAWVIGTASADGGHSIATWNGEGWASAPGGAVSISVDPDGFPYVVTDDNRLLRGT